jgi:hypothetical protein
LESNTLAYYFRANITAQKSCIKSALASSSHQVKIL